ncbi:MAG: DUF4369 domain-containing protein [Pedobacter sp.]|nr:MAG: DUF4369 domain-containing protein [Pedobacter sp.]
MKTSYKILLSFATIILISLIVANLSLKAKYKNGDFDLVNVIDDVFKLNGLDTIQLKDFKHLVINGSLFTKNKREVSFNSNLQISSSINQTNVLGIVPHFKSLVKQHISNDTLYIYFQKNNINENKLMLMKKLLVFAFTLLPLAMFAQKPFSINGNVNGLRNRSKIYLTYQDGSDIADSTWVSNGVFAFKGVLSEPIKATLSLNKNDAQGEVLDITTLYLEPAVINVNGSESLREASISGSVITDDYRRLTSLTKPVYDELAAINAEYGRFTQAQKDDSKLMDEIRNRYTAAEAGLPDILLDYATNNPGSYVSLDAIKQVADNDDRVMEAGTQNESSLQLASLLVIIQTWTM